MINIDWKGTGRSWPKHNTKRIKCKLFERLKQKTEAITRTQPVTAREAAAAIAPQPPLLQQSACDRNHPTLCHSLPLYALRSLPHRSWRYERPRASLVLVLLPSWAKPTGRCSAERIQELPVRHRMDRRAGTTRQSLETSATIPHGRTNV